MPETSKAIYDAFVAKYDNAPLSPNFDRKTVRISVKTFFFFFFFLEITYFQAKKPFKSELAPGPRSALGAPDGVSTNVNFKIIPNFAVRISNSHWWSHSLRETISLSRGYQTFGAREEVDRYLRSPTINFYN